MCCTTVGLSWRVIGERFNQLANALTHWGRVTHICVSKLTIIGSDNGLSPDRRQAIIWTNAGLLLIGPLGTNFSEILIEILTFSFKKMRLKVSSAKRRPFCLGLNVLINRWTLYSGLHPVNVCFGARIIYSEACAFNHCKVDLVDIRGNLNAQRYVDEILATMSSPIWITAASRTDP